jgi:hypothetical protein
LVLSFEFSSRLLPEPHSRRKGALTIMRMIANGARDQLKKGPLLPAAPLIKSFEIET